MLIVEKYNYGVDESITSHSHTEIIESHGKARAQITFNNKIQRNYYQMQILYLIIKIDTIIITIVNYSPEAFILLCADLLLSHS